MKSLCIATLCIVAFSCTKADRTVTLNYEPQIYVVKIEQANNKPIAIKVQDFREEKTKIGSIPIDQIGLFKVPVTIQQEADQFLKEAMTIELKQRGFSIADGGKIVKIDLLKLFGDLDKTEFKIGSQSIYKHDAIGGLVIGLRVLNKDSQVIFAKKLQKAIRMKNVHGVFKSSKDTTLALNTAIQNLFIDLFDDKAFIDALME